MIQEIVEGLVSTLNTAISGVSFRPARVEKTTTTGEVDCSIKVMLADMIPIGLGVNDKFDHTLYIYFDFGSNEKRAAIEVIQAIDDFVDWLTSNYNKGLGFDIGSGYYIRHMKYIPYVAYPGDRETFYHDMVMVRAVWERR